MGSFSVTGRLALSFIMGSVGPFREQGAKCALLPTKSPLIFLSLQLVMWVFIQRTMSGHLAASHAYNGLSNYCSRHSLVNEYCVIIFIMNFIIKYLNYVNMFFKPMFINEN